MPNVVVVRVAFVKMVLVQVGQAFKKTWNIHAFNMFSCLERVWVGCWVRGWVRDWVRSWAWGSVRGWVRGLLSVRLGWKFSGRLCERGWVRLRLFIHGFQVSKKAFFDLFCIVIDTCNSSAVAAFQICGFFLLFLPLFWKWLLYSPDRLSYRPAHDLVWWKMNQ